MAGDYDPRFYYTTGDFWQLPQPTIHCGGCRCFQQYTIVTTDTTLRFIKPAVQPEHEVLFQEFLAWMASRDPEVVDTEVVDTCPNPDSECEHD